MEIPVIDIADLMAAPESAAREWVAGEILRACTGTGFFYLTGHGVGADLIEQRTAGSTPARRRRSWRSSRTAGTAATRRWRPRP